jgi:Ala-tRNA(Pro) deacylase
LSLRQKVFDVIEDMHIPYEVVEHPAVYTMEEMERLNIDSRNEIVKNLFVRDDKKKRFFLITLQKDKRANLKEIGRQLNSRPLSFASEEYLFKYLGLNKGAVSPFGVLNDTDCTVEVVFDRDILRFERIGVHPNENTATVWLRPQDLELIIKEHGNLITYIDI